MEDLLLEILGVVVTSILIPLITFLGVKLNAYLKTKIKNEEFHKYLDIANNAVTISVAETMQTYVDSLKKSGNFSKEAQNEAFAMAKDKALTLITKDARTVLEAAYGDFDKWLNGLIETKVKELK